MKTCTIVLEETFLIPFSPAKLVEVTEGLTKSNNGFKVVTALENIKSGGWTIACAKRELGNFSQKTSAFLANNCFVITQYLSLKTKIKHKNESENKLCLSSCQRFRFKYSQVDLGPISSTGVAVFLDKFSLVLLIGRKIACKILR